MPPANAACPLTGSQKYLAGVADMALRRVRHVRAVAGTRRVALPACMDRENAFNNRA